MRAVGDRQPVRALVDVDLQLRRPGGVDRARRLADAGVCGRSVSNVTACASEDWLEMIRTIGPAPKRRGETSIRWSVIAAVTLIGEGGRGAFV